MVSRQLPNYFLHFIKLHLLYSVLSINWGSFTLFNLRKSNLNQVDSERKISPSN